MQTFFLSVKNVNSQRSKSSVQGVFLCVHIRCFFTLVLGGFNDIHTGYVSLMVFIQDMYCIHSKILMIFIIMNNE